MFTQQFSQTIANQLFEKALPLVADARLAELLRCFAFFAWYAGAGSSDRQAMKDAPAWLDLALRQLDGLR